MNKLYQLHRFGFMHGDFDDRNILMNDGKAMFIDLEDVKPHNCQMNHAIIFDDLQPRQADFGCREIHHVVTMQDVWQRLCRFLWNHRLPFGN